jgi:DNA-directed RNA polymerase I, II, and III subunit RPABC5
MIIPIRCPTCGEVLGDKYEFYLREVRKRKIDKGVSLDKTVYFNVDNTAKTIEGNILDELMLFNVCCRRVMLTHVDLK